METTLQELEAHLAEYVRRVAAGEELTVTEHGEPVVRLIAVPPVKTPEGVEEEAVARLRALPWVRPGIDGRPALPEPVLRIEPGEKTLAEIVSEMRG